MNIVQNTINSGNSLFFNLQINNLSGYPKRLHALGRAYGDVFLSYYYSLSYPSLVNKSKKQDSVFNFHTFIRSNRQSSEKESMINENKIRETCASNRGRGFKMLMDVFQEPIYNYIRRLVVSHEDAEDVLQEVFIRVFRHLDQFRSESSLSTWIYQIATNESLRLLNDRKEERNVASEEIQEELINKLQASDYIDYENELAVKFQEAILSLPEKQRLVFNLRYYDELEYEEIARILDSKVETLKVNYHYAKEKIKEYILNR